MGSIALRAVYFSFVVAILCGPCRAQFTLIGDTNDNDQVFLDDFNNVVNGFGISDLGDADGDGDTDIADFGNVANSFGGQEQVDLLLGRQSSQSIRLGLNAVAAFDTVTFDSRPLPDLSLPNGDAAGLVFQVEVALSVLARDDGSQGFGNIAFDVLLGPGLQVHPFVPGFQPSEETFDTNGDEPGGVVPLFDTNSDFGVPNDLLDIVVSIAEGLDGTADADPRIGIAEDQPEVLGLLFVEWDGVTPTFLGGDIRGQSALLTGGNLELVDGTAEVQPLSFGGGVALPHGDHNFDGRVDAADYTRIRDDAPAGDGDFAFQLDFVRWVSNFGVTADGPEAVPTPEPNGFSLAAFSCCLAARAGARSARTHPNDANALHEA